MTGSFRAEILKLRKRWATWVLLAVWLVLTEIFGYVVPYSTYRGDQGKAAKAGDDPGGLLLKVLPGHLVGTSLAGYAVFVGALALIFGALATGSEYGWGTWKTSLIQHASRGEVIAGKLAALVAMVFGGVLVTFAVGGATGLALASAESASAHLPSAGDLLKGYLLGGLILSMWCLFGAMLGFLARGVALPVGLGVVWVLGVENLISQMARNMLHGLRWLHDVMPGATSGSIVYSLDPIAERGTGPAPGVMHVVSGGRGILTVLLYAAAFAVATFFVVRERDVS
jgi:ABC-type transport system involved in multi-copper enzyme maturation permease subunit